jgi:hypothetical protein
MVGRSLRFSSYSKPQTNQTITPPTDMHAAQKNQIHTNSIAQKTIAKT